MFIKNILHVPILRFAHQIHKIVKFFYYKCKILFMQVKKFLPEFSPSQRDPWVFQVFPEIAKKQIFFHVFQDYSNPSVCVCVCVCVCLRVCVCVCVLACVCVVCV